MSDHIREDGQAVMVFTADELSRLDEALKVIQTTHPMAKFGYAKERFEPLEQRTQRLLDAICARAD